MVGESELEGFRRDRYFARSWALLTRDRGWIKPVLLMTVSLLVPFVKVEQPYDELKEIIENIWDWWIEEGKNRERLGELMKRASFQKLLEVTNTEAQAFHVKEPRNNPYIFFKEDEVPGGFKRDLADYRSRHQR